MSRVPHASAALVAAWMVSCQSVIAVDPGAPIGLDDPRAIALLAQFRDESAAREALRAAARLTLDAPGVSLSRPQRLVVQRPASLRIELLGLFDQVAGVLVTDGADFGFVDLSSGVRDAGPVDDGVLWRTARVDLTPADAVALLLGAPALDEGGAVVSARRFEDGGVGVSTRGADAVRTRWLEWDDSGRLRRAALREPDGSAVWVARYSDWRDIEGKRFAHRIELDFPRVEAEASVRFQAVELEPALAPELFVLQLAPGG